MGKKLILLIFTALFLVSANLRGANNDLESKPSFDSLKVRAQRVMDTPQEIVYLDSMLVLAQAMDSIQWQCRAMSSMARNYYNRVIPDSLIYWAGKLDPFALEHKQYQSFFDAYSLLCQSELYEKKYESALEKSNRLYMLAKEFDNADGMIASYEVSGMLYMETFRYVEAIKSFTEGIALQSQQKNPRYNFQFQFMSYIIECYLNLRDYKGAKESIAEGYKLADLCKEHVPNFPWERCVWLLSCYNIEMYVALNMPQKAEANIIESAKYLNRVEDLYVYIKYHLASAGYYQMLGNYKEALKCVDLILSETDLFLPAMKVKAELLLEAGKGMESARLYRSSLALIDSTYNESLSHQINQLRSIHEVDKLELRNQQIELEANQFRLSVVIGLVLILSFILVFILFNYFRMKRMKNKLEISDKQLKLEKEQLIASEKALSIAKEKAEVSNRIKDIFLANLNHEVRTPLNNIVLFSKLLTDLNKKKEGNEYASVIKENSDMLLKLVNDTVSVSMLQTDTLPFDYKDVDVCLLCRSILGNYEAKLPSGVKLISEFSQESYLMKTDSNRLKQVLDNLLLNAVKFTEKGSIKLSVTIDENNGVAKFVVEDTGVGVPKDKQDKIFESFEKNDSFTQGMGLGLTICRLISDRFGGSIELDTEYDKGARFVFTHPIK